MVESDFYGGEFDWVACDDLEEVALLSTAGWGYLSPGVLQDPMAQEDAISLILAMVATTHALFFPLCHGVNTWREVAERGLFAYDGVRALDAYEVVAAPAEPIRVDALPRRARDVVLATRLPFRFRQEALIERAMFLK